jgi:hypothetical protein
MQKLHGFWKKIDPYKDYPQLEKPPKLVVLQIGALCICCISFFVYLAFSIDVYLKTPEPSKATLERVFPGNPKKALFQFTIMLPVNTGEVNPIFSTFYRSPLSDSLTERQAVEYKISFSVPIIRTQVYEVYTFPVYGTVDPTSGTSTILYFQPAMYITGPLRPLLFAVGPPGVEFSSLDVKTFNPNAKARDTEFDFLVSDPKSNTQFFQMYENLDSSGPEIRVELVLEKTVSSNSEVNYTASFFAPPSYSPRSFENPAPQRFISISVKPNVNVVTFSPKNLFTFLGSIGGIFPIFIAIGGIIASLLWSRMEQKASDESTIEPMKNTEMN